MKTSQPFYEKLIFSLQIDVSTLGTLVFSQYLFLVQVVTTLSPHSRLHLNLCLHPC